MGKWLYHVSAATVRRAIVYPGKQECVYGRTDVHLVVHLCPYCTASQWRIHGAISYRISS